MLFRDLPGFTRFKSDPTQKYDGFVPFDTPIDAFQIGHDIFWILPVDILTAAMRGAVVGVLTGSLFAGAVGQDIVAGDHKGSFEFKVIDPATNQVQFWQRITITLSFTAIVVAGFLGGVSFFAWLIKKEEIKTFIINGSPTDLHPSSPDANNPAWRYTLGNSKLAEQGILIPGGGTGYNDGGGEVNTFWQGPFYVNVNIPANAGLEIVRDEWQARIARLPLWSIRALQGDAEIDAFFEQFGSLVKLYERAGTVYSSLASLPGRDEEIGLVGIGRDPSGTEDEAGVFYCGVTTSAGVIEYKSLDSGVCWEPLPEFVEVSDSVERLGMIPRLDANGQPVPLLVWGKGFDHVRFILLEDGLSRGTVAIKNGELSWKTSRDNYAGAILVDYVKGKEPFELLIDERGVYWASSVNEGEFISENGGETWYPFVPDKN
jgi:hypothetical protein